MIDILLTFEKHMHVRLNSQRMNVSEDTTS